MNDETLKLLKELQGVIREKMGELQSGDLYYCPNDGRDNKIKVIESGYFDSMQYDSYGKLGCWVKAEPCCPDVAIVIPDFYSRDPDEFDRGLSGMFKPNTFVYLKPVFDAQGTKEIHPGEPVHNGEWSVMLEGMDQPIIASDLYLAVLKALKWQKEQERGG